MYQEDGSCRNSEYLLEKIAPDAFFGMDTLWMHHHLFSKMRR
jgi:hypothetical protein